jgi:hypothetical protein
MYDITFCDKADCEQLNCIRNLKRLTQRPALISVASLEGSVYCMKKNIPRAEQQPVKAVYLTLLNKFLDKEILDCNDTRLQKYLQNLKARINKLPTTKI